MTLNFTVKGDYIELCRLLKALKVVSSGGEAKTLVDEGVVYLNGIREFQRRAKVKSGDKVELITDEIRIIIQVK
jgi:ribosome-associated protein